MCNVLRTVLVSIAHMSYFHFAPNLSPTLQTGVRETLRSAPRLSSGPRPRPQHLETEAQSTRTHSPPAKAPDFLIAMGRHARNLPSLAQELGPLWAASQPTLEPGPAPTGQARNLIQKRIKNHARRPTLKPFRCRVLVPNRN